MIVHNTDEGTQRAIASAERFGQTIMHAAQEIKDKWDRMDEVSARANWIRFKAAEDSAFADMARNVQPQQVRGFSQTYAAGYQDRANAFLAGLPDRLRDTYQVASLEFGYSKAADAQTYERTEMERSVRIGIGDTVQQSILPRAQSAAQLPEGDPAKVRLLKEIEHDARTLISSNPALAPLDADTLQREVALQIQLAFAGALPDAERVRLDPSTGHQTVGERIIQIESGGDPGADNPNSTALGAGQFTERTWLGLIGRVRPDLAQGKSKSELLALRTDPDVSLQMVDALASENAQGLRARGQEATPGNLYLAHFLGAAGAVTMLGAKPETPAYLVNPDAADSNRAVFYNKDGTPKTAGEVVQWATAKMAGAEHVDWSSALDLIPFATKVQLGVDASTSLLRADVASHEQRERTNAQRLNELLNGIADGKAGLADIDLAYGGGSGWLTNYDDRQKALRAVEERDRNSIAARSVIDRLAGGEAINPFNADDRKAVDALYAASLAEGGGGDLLSGSTETVGILQRVVARTGIIPTMAQEELRRGMWMTTGSEQERAFMIADNLHRASPQAFRLAFSEDDLKRLQEYRSLALLPPDVRASRLDPARDTERAKLFSQLEGEGRKIAQQIPMNEIASIFDPEWNLDEVVEGVGAIVPVVGSVFDDDFNEPLDGLTAAALRADYETVFADRYAALNKDREAAKAATAELLAQKWGGSRAGSSAYVMPYPPEHFFPTIDGSHDWMTSQLRTLVEREYPDAQSWAPVSLPFTEGAVGAGRTPTWAVGVVDKDGVFRTLLPADDTAYAKAHPEDARVQFKPGWPFDYETVHADRTARFRQERADALAQEPPAQSLRDAIAGYQKAVGAGNTAPPPLEEPPSLIPPLTDEERSQLRPEGLVQ